MRSSASLKELEFGNPTRLYDAIDASLDELRGIDGRRVVLVFTDGDDTASKIGPGHVCERARDEEVMVYAIGLESELDFNGRHGPDAAGPRPEKARGRDRRRLLRAEDDATTSARRSRASRRSSTASTRSASRRRTLDGKVHKLEVRVKKPGLKARARKSYLAVAEGPSPSSK